MGRRDQGQPQGKPLMGMYGAWLEQDDRGRLLLRQGKFLGEYLDDVASQHEKYLRWVLEDADYRPTPREEQALRAALGEDAPVSAPRRQVSSWGNVIVGNRAFSAPPELIKAFDEEMRRLQTLFPSEVQAFEVMLANSSLTPLEGLE